MSWVEMDAKVKPMRHPARSLGEMCFLSKKNSALHSHTHMHTPAGDLHPLIPGLHLGSSSYSLFHN